MFGLSWIEFFVILIVALVVIGPDKLPEVARGLARMIRQFQRIASEVRESIRMEDLETTMRESSHYTPPAMPASLPPPAHFQEPEKTPAPVVPPIPNQPGVGKPPTPDTVPSSSTHTHDSTRP
ncbi:MAG: twin-arginine translocase TatA/TatE family subunit [Magnetococcales bacterium]|nr:twin-arginine translocase TatA/TatE family subunit [Magnetococcales bacterium]